MSLLRPLHARHRVAWTDVVQLRDLTARCGPKINARSQTDSQLVLRRPINQIEVEIVLQRGCIKHFEGSLRNLALFGVRRRQKLVFFEACKRWQLVRKILG